MMTWTAVKKNMRKIGFTDAQIQSVAEIYPKVAPLPQFQELLTALVQKENGAELQKRCIGLEKQTDIGEYRIFLCALCVLTDDLITIYQKSGTPLAVIFDTLQDFVYKTVECQKVYGDIGIFAYQWYQCFFDGRLFKLGRLEYEIDKYRWSDEVTVDGYTVRYGDKAISIHIPSDGKLSPESVDASLQLAYHFFGGNGKVVLQCSSWLLFPPYISMFGENMRSFADRFTIVGEKSKEEFTEKWRIFDTMGEDLPQKTSLQRAFTRYIKNGGPYGSGRGLLILEGNRYESK